MKNLVETSEIKGTTTTQFPNQETVNTRRLESLVSISSQDEVIQEINQPSQDDKFIPTSQEEVSFLLIDQTTHRSIVTADETRDYLEPVWMEIDIPPLEIKNNRDMNSALHVVASSISTCQREIGRIYERMISFRYSQVRLNFGGMTLLVDMSKIGAVSTTILILIISLFFPIIGVYIQFILWWFILGVASSIGFGTGCHTGSLFLVPYIIKNLDNFLLSASAAYIWGAGTAFGEIPPYIMTRNTIITREELLRSDHLFFRINKFMINFLEKYGMIGILVMASYPNMMFDLCGLICGYFKYPFWKFFLPTFIGKVVIKVTGQLLFVYYICTQTSHSEWLLSKVSAPVTSNYWNYFVATLTLLLFLRGYLQNGMASRESRTYTSIIQEVFPINPFRRSR